MTREKLEEIKEAERGERWECDNGLCDYLAPLIEALEEAWKERDEAREQVKVLSAYSGERHAFYQTADGKLSGLVVDKDGPWVRACDARTTERERDEARAEVERLNKRLESEQHFIDAACHYRNLAIVLGAKPEQMLGKFDRELCEGGIDPDETSGGYHVSVNQQLDELKDVWNELEKLRLEHDAVIAKLGQLREALTKRYGSKTCVASIGFGQTCVGNQSVYCHVCHIQHLLGLPSRAPPADELELAQVARNDALAEVEQLRSAISRFVAQYPWQDGPEIQELKSLKEEG